eukprot:1002119_1
MSEDDEEDEPEIDSDEEQNNSNNIEMDENGMMMIEQNEEEEEDDNDELFATVSNTNAKETDSTHPHHRLLKLFGTEKVSFGMCPEFCLLPYIESVNDAFEK